MFTFIIIACLIPCLLVYFIHLLISVYCPFIAWIIVCVFRAVTFLYFFTLFYLLSFLSYIGVYICLLVYFVILLLLYYYFTCLLCCYLFCYSFICFFLICSFLRSHIDICIYVHMICYSLVLLTVLLCYMLYMRYLMFL